ASGSPCRPRTRRSRARTPLPSLPSRGRPRVPRRARAARHATARAASTRLRVRSLGGDRLDLPFLPEPFEQPRLAGIDAPRHRRLERRPEDQLARPGTRDRREKGLELAFVGETAVDLVGDRAIAVGTDLL